MARGISQMTVTALVLARASASAAELDATGVLTVGLIYSAPWRHLQPAV
jgi:hypothetical protein